MNVQFVCKLEPEYTDNGLIFVAISHAKSSFLCADMTTEPCLLQWRNKCTTFVVKCDFFVNQSINNNNVCGCLDMRIHESSKPIQQMAAAFMQHIDGLALVCVVDVCWDKSCTETTLPVTTGRQLIVAQPGAWQHLFSELPLKQLEELDVLVKLVVAYCSAETIHTKQRSNKSCLCY